MLLSKSSQKMIQLNISIATTLQIAPTQVCTAVEMHISGGHTGCGVSLLLSYSKRRVVFVIFGCERKLHQLKQRKFRSIQQTLNVCRAADLGNTDEENVIALPFHAIHLPGYRLCSQKVTSGAPLNPTHTWLHP